MAISNVDSMIQTSTVFDPNKGFHELRIVRVGLLLVGILSAILIAMAFSSRPGFQPDAAGLHELALLLQVPLGALTLTIPFFALMAAAHRSEQTKHQMDLTRKQIARTDKQILIASDQNNFSNYYKHLEEFEAFALSHLEETFKLQSPQKLHSKIFPRARSGEFGVDPKALIDFQREIEQFIRNCEQFGMKNGHSSTAFAISANSIRMRAKYHFEPYGQGVKWVDNGRPFHVESDSLGGYLRHHIDLFQAVNETLKFDNKHETPERLIHLIGVNFAEIPGGSIKEAEELNFDKLLTESAHRQGLAVRLGE